MDNKTYCILGTLFIIAGGLIYSIERAIAYLVWVGQMNALSSWPTLPELPTFLTNFFIPVFIFVGIIFFLVGYKKGR